MVNIYHGFIISAFYIFIRMPLSKYNATLKTDGPIRKRQKSLVITGNYEQRENRRKGRYLATAARVKEWGKISEPSVHSQLFKSQGDSSYRTENQAQSPEEANFSFNRSK